MGQTDNIAERISSHSKGISKYTSSFDDWELMYTEQFETRSEAIRREIEIKKKKSRKYIEWLLSKNN